MPQTILILVGELQPIRAPVARKLIENLRLEVERHGKAMVAARQASHPYEPLVTEMPGLHFASMMVFDDERFDPMLIVELNFDGPAEDFLPRLQTPILKRYLRAILRCCKPPGDDREKLYKAATTDGDVTGYLKTLIVRPAVAHQGNRGLDRDRILKERDLYDSVQSALATPGCATAATAEALHQELRKAVVDQHGLLKKQPAERIPIGERLLDWARLAGLVAAVLALPMVPGVLLALVAPTAGWALAVVVLIALVAAVLRHVLTRRAADPTPPRARQLPPKAPFWTDPILATGAELGGGVVLAFLLLLALWPGLWPALCAGFASLVVVVFGIGLWLRRLEKTDLVQEKPQIDPDTLREIMKLENQISQNHMGSVVHVKPGALRAVLIRLGLLGLGLLLRIAARDGYLAQMRTIHFAHWALLDNGSRLVFFSNFDSSWESYLDDFIEKANPGLTLAWSNCLGFPRTKFLVEEGATHGPLFKTWARHSMARGLFWVSAYPTLSVNQIERNFAIAAGLRKTKLTSPAAETWAALL